MFAENKTGVGYCQEQLSKALHDQGIPFVISVRKNDISVRKYLIPKKNAWIKQHLVYERRFIWPEAWGAPPVELAQGYYPTCFESFPWYRHLLPYKRIAWIHDMMSMRYPQYYTKEDLQKHQKMFASAKKADIILTVSKTTKMDIIHYLHIRPERIKVIYNGLDECFLKDSPVFDITRHFVPESGIDFSRNYYLYIGAMRKNKNLLNAIKGFEKYLKETGKEDVYFYIAGSKSHEYSNLKKYVDADQRLREKVLFLGYITDEEKLALYKNAKALLFVSEYEGFGIPVIEAMASRIPVVTSDCSSMKEIGEGHAILADPFSPKSICEGLMETDRQAADTDFMEKNYRFAMKFTWRRAAEIFCRILKGLS
ncbi:MAG: glycosyltransferase family 4 protein [Lachnospiraceae bacterium]|nr:glycosyltransferase family 4 protein [Lachnospiraceae bacterium]MBD5482511.1 glycosyltransferase family 4 protein [Lachnospiraceae bacterium]